MTDQAWEFKHPEFQANKKDNLDNIRRKAPAPRKSAQNTDEGFANQQIELLQSQLMATQQQVANLTDKFNDLAQGHVVLLQQVVSLQKVVKNHDGVMHKMLGFLHSTDAQRRNSRADGGFANGNTSGLGAEPTPNDANDHPASPLQQASELLEGFSTANLPDKTLEAMTHDYGHLRSDYSTPPNEHGGAQIVPHSDASSNHLGYTMASDLDSMVYPVGHTNGIDPVNAEHIHNIPYSLPPQMPENIVSETAPETQMFPGRKKSMQEQVWGINKPRILLVEDDKMCARIGSKFLQLYECGVEIAVSLQVRHFF
jgi:osomolarity two-component system response regulator SKN7